MMKDKKGEQKKEKIYDCPSEARTQDLVIAYISNSHTL